MTNKTEQIINTIERNLCTLSRFNIISNYITSKFYVSIEICFSELTLYKIVSKYLIHKNPNIRMSNCISFNYYPTGRLRNCTYCKRIGYGKIKLAKSAYIDFTKTKLYRISKYGWIIIESPAKKDNDNCVIDTALIHFIGKDTYKNLHELINFVYSYYNKSNINKIDYMEKDENTIATVIDRKLAKDIIWDKLEELSNYILSWKQMKHLYSEKHIPYKLSILLYGKPGTGKTSICNYIAGLTNRGILSIKPSASHQSIKNSIDSEIHKAVIILFEDIDLFFNETVPLININSERSSDSINDKLHYLLQLFNGFNTPDDTIIICTTNYPEKLDERLLRPGRFDLIYEIPEFNRDNAIKMCERYDVPYDIILKDMGDTIKPSELECKCIQYSIQKNMELIKNESLS